MSRTTPLYIVICSATADPDVMEFLVKHTTERHAHFCVVTKALGQQVRIHLTPHAQTSRRPAVHLRSEDTYAMLVHEQGWTSEEWSGWCLRTMLAEVFAG